MATFVLIHGAWVGGWIWKCLVPILRTAGHDVYTPTLTGLGERCHLLRPDIDLDTHIQDVVNLISYEDLFDVILVGWSYAGMVITGVAERVPDRVAHLVYLDADVPENGQSRFDLETPEGRASWETSAREHGEGWYSPFFVNDDTARAVVADDTLRRWCLAHLNGQRHPLKTLTQPVKISHPAALALPRTYISCIVDTGELYAGMAEKVRSRSGWRYREVQANHFAPITHPQDIAELLFDTVSS